MRASYGIFALIIALTACSGKKRPFGDSPIDGLGGSGGSSPGTSAVERETDASVGAGVDPNAAREEPPVATLARPDDTTQSSGNLACDGDAGTCTTPDAGPAPAVCTATGPRDCSSDLDNDCDGEPDNTADDTCACVVGTTEPCNEHPGLDGQGECRAGSRTCILDAETLTTAWSECEGSVGPGDQDSCVPGDDADCDGTPNEGCSCVDGETQSCGSTTNTGPCQIGTSTCVDGRFGPCVGAVAPASADSCSSRNDDSNCNGIPFDGCSCVNDETQPCGMTDTGVCQLGTRTCLNGAFGQCVGQVTPRARDCRSQQDNDCNGQADNTIDNVCQCSVGGSQACDTHPGLDGVGRCRAGSRTCTAGQNNSTSFFGTCTGSLGPLPRDCGSAADNDCDGKPDNTRDNICQCVPGQGNGPCSADPENSRCNSQGRCVPCETDGDCSLVSGGRIECAGGECVSPLPPLSCSSAEPPLAAAPSTLSIAGPPPEPQGGDVLDGVYVKTEVRFYNGLSTQVVPSVTLQIQAGTFMQRTGEFVAPIGGRQPESVAAGTVTTTGTSVSFTTSTCVDGSSSGSRTNTVGFDASTTRLLIHRAGLVEVFDR